MKQRVFSLILALMLLSSSAPAYGSGGDEFDALRHRWVEVLTGGDYPMSGALYANYIMAEVQELTESARSNWNSMIKSADRVNSYSADACLWSNAVLGDTRDIYARNSSRASITFSRLAQMAVAYKTKTSALYGNGELLTDIIEALDWLYTYKFNENTPRNNRDSKASNDNWYHWEISIPTHLNNIQSLLYEELNAAQIASYQKAIDNQVTTLGSASTASNRLACCIYLLVAGIVKKDSAKIEYARDAVSPALTYVTTDDGFYQDGSFIQHHTVPNNGGYGLSALGYLTDIMYLMKGSPWDITDPNSENIYRWVEDSFLTTTYEGRSMDSTRGRSISRTEITYDLAETLTKITAFAPEEKAAYYKRIIKYWVNNNSAYNYYSGMGRLHSLIKLYDIISDPAVIAAYDPVMYKQFYGMDRAVQLGPGYAFNVSMFSSRIRNYESINGENLKGWHTADGMTYLYTADLAQYDDGYWATVDKYRLAGTTVPKLTTAKPDTFGNAHTGGVCGGLYGVSAMHYSAGADAGGNAHTLTAKKSWFAFDDEIVCLGADITSQTQGDDIETIVENRKINTAGSNRLTVDGELKEDSLGRSEVMANVSWIHMEGNAASTLSATDTGIGYYFPEAATVSALREARTDNWKSINSGGSSALLTRNYLSLALSHGEEPSGQTYAYVLLPSKSSAQVAAYAASPDITVLANTADVQAARDTEKNIFGASFWSDKKTTVADVTCTSPAAVMIVDCGDTVEISVSDPTQLNEGVIELEVDRALGEVLSADDMVIAESAGGKVRLFVNVKDSLGKTFKAVLYKTGGSPEIPPVPTGVTYRALEGSKIEISWNADEGSAHYRVSRARSAGGVYSALGTSFANTFVDSGTGGGMNYYYKVAAASEAGISDYSEPISAWTIPDAPYMAELQTQMGETALVWNEVIGADAYKVFASQGENADFQEISPENYKQTSYKIPRRNENYFYRVIASNEGGDSPCSPTVASLYNRASYLINQNFDDFELGDIEGQRGWSAYLDPDTNLAKIINITDTDKVLRIYRNGSNQSSASCGFAAPQGTTLTLEARVIPEAGRDDYKTLLTANDAAGKAVIHIYSQQGSMYVYNNGSGPSARFTIFNGTVDVTKEYHFRVVINTAVKRFDLYVDGELMASNLAYRDTSAGMPASIGFAPGNNNNYLTVNEVKVYYLPNAPANLSASGSPGRGIALEWDAAAGAEGYSLYRSTQENGVYSRIYSGAARQFSDTACPLNIAYYYRVVSEGGGGASPLSDYASAVCDMNEFSLLSGGVDFGGQLTKTIPAAPGSYEVKASYCYSGTEERTVRYIMAVVQDGCIIGYMSTIQAVAQGGDLDFVNSITVTEGWAGSDVRIKCMLWDNETPITPLTQVLEIGN